MKATTKTIIISSLLATMALPSAFAYDLNQAQTDIQAINTQLATTTSKANYAESRVDHQLGMIYKNTDDLAAFEKKVNSNFADVAKESDVKNVGALSAAMSSMHPMQYGPSQKAQLMASVGNYKGKTAVGLGGAYYINQDKMVTLQGAFGKGFMVGAGYTMKFGKSSNVTPANVQNLQEQLEVQAEEIQELKAQVAALTK